VHRKVNFVKTLFQSNTKAKSFFFTYLAGLFNPVFESLSRMIGNYQVSCFEDNGGVIRLSYPTITNLVLKISIEILQLKKEI